MVNIFPATHVKGMHMHWLEIYIYIGAVFLVLLVVFSVMNGGDLGMSMGKRAPLFWIAAFLLWPLVLIAFFFAAVTEDNHPEEIMFIDDED